MSAEAEDILCLRNDCCITAVLYKRASRKAIKKSRFDTVILFLIACRKRTGTYKKQMLVFKIPNV